MERYSRLAEDLREAGFPTTVMPLELGCRGVLDRSNAANLEVLLNQLGIRSFKKVRSDLGKLALLGSYRIWLARQSDVWTPGPLLRVGGCTSPPSSSPPSPRASPPSSSVSAPPPSPPSHRPSFCSPSQSSKSVNTICPSVCVCVCLILTVWLSWYSYVFICCFLCLYAQILRRNVHPHANRQLLEISVGLISLEVMIPWKCIQPS